MSLLIAAHKNFLIRILKDAFADPVAGPILGFKGGTAVYLFYGLDRFSVDLDFDLLEKERAEDVSDRMGAILREYGKLLDHRIKRYSLFSLLALSDMPGHNLKVEINRCDFGSRYEVKSFLGIPMKVMVREDMAAHKLAALYEREGKTNRDIYDVEFFLRNRWPVNRRIVESRSGLGFMEFLDRCVDIVSRIDERRILSGIGDLLDPERKKWARQHLKSEAIFALRLLRETG